VSRNIFAIIYLKPQTGFEEKSEMHAFIEPYFQTEEAAREKIESLRWPSGPVCPSCGVVGHSYATKKRGVYRCAERSAARTSPSPPAPPWSPATSAYING
jgi:hypothetical protein